MAPAEEIVPVSSVTPLGVFTVTVPLETRISDTVLDTITRELFSSAEEPLLTLLEALTLGVFKLCPMLTLVVVETGASTVPVIVTPDSVLLVPLLAGVVEPEDPHPPCNIHREKRTDTKIGSKHFTFFCMPQILRFLFQHFAGFVLPAFKGQNGYSFTRKKRSAISFQFVK